MRLSSDNPDLMPITDAVYGRRKGKPVPKPPRRPERRTIADALGADAIAKLALRLERK